MKASTAAYFWAIEESGGFGFDHQRDAYEQGWEDAVQRLTSDEAVAAAAKASDEWFGKDGDLSVGLSAMSTAQARVELAAVADLLRSAPSPDHEQAPAQLDEAGGE